MVYDVIARWIHTDGSGQHDLHVAHRRDLWLDTYDVIYQHRFSGTGVRRSDRMHVNVPLGEAHRLAEEIRATLPFEWKQVEG